MDNIGEPPPSLFQEVPSRRLIWEEGLLHSGSFHWWGNSEAVLQASLSLSAFVQLLFIEATQEVLLSPLPDPHPHQTQVTKK